MVYIKGGCFKPVVAAEDKSNYIDTLDQANKGNLKPFVQYLSGLVLAKTRECINFVKSMQEKTPDDLLSLRTLHRPRLGTVR
jgi:hypothetical protein